MGRTSVASRAELRDPPLPDGIPCCEAQVSIRRPLGWHIASMAHGVGRMPKVGVREAAPDAHNPTRAYSTGVLGPHAIGMEMTLGAVAIAVPTRRRAAVACKPRGGFEVANTMWTRAFQYRSTQRLGTQSDGEGRRTFARAAHTTNSKEKLLSGACMREVLHARKKRPGPSPAAVPHNTAELPRLGLGYHALYMYAEFTRTHSQSLRATAVSAVSGPR